MTYKYCPDCGEKTVEGAAFCVACGRALTQTGSAKTTAVALGAALAVSVVVYLVAVTLTGPAASQPTPAAGHTADAHRHDDPPALAALKARAANGEAAALIDLAEAEIQQAGADRHYLQDAAATLERVVASYPNHGYSLRLLANINYDLGRGPAAIDYYRRYLDLYPDDANARTDLGTQYLAMGEVERAIASYEQALAVFPDFYNAYYNLHRAYEAHGDTEKAAAAKAKAQEIERRVGKRFAPDPDLPRLPEGVAAKTTTDTTGAAESAHATTDAPRDLTSNGIDYMPVEAFFKVHPIIGPKMTDFRAEDGKGIMTLENFPMDKMPEGVRKVLDDKITVMMQALDERAVLEIRDRATNRLMRSYTGKAD